ncbi:MAG: 1-deoxy-D-xylulose-5-phosphate reductoisomerase [Clostridia bacterium]|nr:1-deoxy-D-xylulose-5-phosphate reductoisomerase [Clostridia bacterium]
MAKTVAVLGATGSVGTQALDVARSRGYNVDFISAGSNWQALENIARELKPRAVAMASPDAARLLALALKDTPIRVLCSEEGIEEGIATSSAEVVVNSILGEAGLLPSLAVIASGKRLALANKESLVIAGDIVMSRARECGVEIIPVDSEHSAIFQSLKSGKPSEVKRLILTASGGPFYGYTRERLASVTLADTLAHPTWKMGRKITVDSATLMNKGFEVIEAAHLFGIPTSDIRVTIHRESILHSAVEYIDNSVIGELSVPDMRMCVQYAVDYPCRFPTASAELDLFAVGKLSFAEPDNEAFPFLELAKRAMSLGGAMPAVMNALDEVAVGAFLEERISFLDIYDTVLYGFDRLTSYKEEKSLEGILSADREARRVAEEYIANK